MALRGRGSPLSVIIPVSGIGKTGSTGPGFANPGTDCARFYAPDLPDSAGIVIRGARLFASDELGTATAQINIMNQTTTMLTTSLSVTAVGSGTFTLANNGREVITPGRYVRIDAAAGAGTWDTTNGWAGISVQLDYDRL